MRRYAIPGLIGIGLLVAAILYGWAPLQEHLRSRQIRQCKLLDHGISLQIDELYYLPGRQQNLLYVTCHYPGGRPFGYLEASLLASPDGPALYPDRLGCECASAFGDGGFMWVFGAAPEHCQQFTLRYTVNPRGRDKHHIDFILPNLPKPYTTTSWAN